MDNYKGSMNYILAIYLYNTLSYFLTGKMDIDLIFYIAVDQMVRKGKEIVLQ